MMFQDAEFGRACGGGKGGMLIAEAFREYAALVEVRLLALLAQRPRKIRNPRPRKLRR